jgi:arylsulfatase A-like enzyme
MAILSLLSALPIVLQSDISRADERTEPQPSFVLIVADDLGYGDLGVTGAPDISTPNIDQLAARGLRFTNAYANAPACSPARVALLTGQYQQRTGYDRIFLAYQREIGIPSRLVLLPELLREVGYTSGIFGKWHLGYSKDSFPTRHGFDEFVGFVAGNIDYFAHTDRLGNHDLWRGEAEIYDDRYFTDLVVEESLSFLNSHHDEPFFLYVPFSAPHDPFQGPEHRDSAGNQQVTLNVNRKRAVYKSMVEALDAGVGRLLDHLEKLDIADRTVVIFMSDNGGLPIVARNAPFSGFKATLWEGGIRPPLILRWPAIVPSEATSDALVAGMDVFPTIVELAGASLPAGHPIDGVSLASILAGDASEPIRDALYFRYQNPRGVEQRAMIQGGWKYLLDKTGKEHLFNLDADPAESNDLAEDDPERLTAMKEKYWWWLNDVLSGVTRLPEEVP